LEAGGRLRKKRGEGGSERKKDLALRLKKKIVRGTRNLTDRRGKKEEEKVEPVTPPCGAKKRGDEVSWENGRKKASLALLREGEKCGRDQHKKSGERRGRGHILVADRGKENSVGKKKKLWKP